MQDLNTCPVGSIIDISDIPEYQGLTLVRISDSGATVSGGVFGSREVMVSGRSPAVIVKRGSGAPIPPVASGPRAEPPIVLSDLADALK